MKTLNKEEIIDLCSKMIHTTAEEVGQDKYKNTCFVNYIKELVLKYGLEGGVKGGGRLCLEMFEESFCYSMIGRYVWSMQGIAYVHLAKYGQHSLGTYNGVNILDLLFIPQQDGEGNLLRDEEGKVITISNPLYAWFLEPKGFNLWIKWVYHMFNCVQRTSPLSSPNDLLSQVVNNRKLTTEKCNKGLPDVSIPCKSSESSKTEEIMWRLKQCYELPSNEKIPKT